MFIATKCYQFLCGNCIVIQIRAFCPFLNRTRCLQNKVFNNFNIRFFYFFDKHIQSDPKVLKSSLIISNYASDLLQFPFHNIPVLLLIPGLLPHPPPPPQEIQNIIQVISLWASANHKTRPVTDTAPNFILHVYSQNFWPPNMYCIL